MISLLLFDVGDTILDTPGHQEALQEAHRAALARFGFELSAGEYQQLDHDKMRQFVPSPMHAITWHYARPDVRLFNEITREVRSHYPEIWALGFRLHPGIAAVLEQLAKEYSLALAGNAPARITENLDELGVLRWFRHREVSGSLGIKKPDEGFFRTILDRAGCSPSEAIMIGDRLDNDIIPAKRLGLRTVWFRQGRYAALEPRVPDELPDATVTDLESLPSAIRSIAGKAS
ncbi:MAG: HAD family hydrolase [Candidatus Aminicenantes bacterium]|nr:HAD family hydrolase [Candidatus Aminicenantes bacterium]